MAKKKNETYGFSTGNDGTDGGWVYPNGHTPRTAVPRRSTATATGQGSVRNTEPRRSTANSTGRENTRTAAPRSQNQRTSGGRVVLDERQRQIYEQAYIKKYGRSPYAGASAVPRAGEARRSAPDTRGQTNARTAAPRPDRREAMFREEERARRAAEEARRKMAEQAAKEAAEARRREAARRRMEAARKAEARRRAAEARAKLERRRRRRHVARVVKFHIKVVVLTFLVSAVLLAAGVYLKFWNDPDSFATRVTYYYGDEKVSGTSAELSYKDGDMRVNFSKTAEYFGFAVSGNSESMKFIIGVDSDSDSSGAGTEDTLEFIIGSNTVLINGTPVNLSSVSEYTGSSLWVSSEIMDYFSSGVSFTVVNSKKVVFSRAKTFDEEGKVKRDGDGNYIYEEISLLYKPMLAPSCDSLDDIYGESSSTASTATASDVTFTADLSAYEEYMNPANADEYLILVNKQNTVDEDYVPDDLVAVSDTRQDGRATQQMRECAAKALEALYIEMRACGYSDVSVTSGYRSYDYQTQLFNTYLNQEMSRGYSEEDARAQVLTYSAYPGTSEHQTGLCCDMHNLGSASTDFAEEEVYEWLCDNAWKFGFILRFPEDKTEITGYSFEPWHYRFVGRYAAEQIHEQGLCLEEYLNS